MKVILPKLVTACRECKEARKIIADLFVGEVSLEKFLNLIEVAKKMIVDIHNPNKATRIFYDGIDGSQREYRVEPGETVQAIIDDQTADRLMKGDLVLSVPSTGGPPLPAPAAPDKPKPPLAICGMFGIGDNLHQRAAIRELMKTYDVTLGTCHVEMYHDFIEQGLKLYFHGTRLRAQAKTIQREQGSYIWQRIPSTTGMRKIWYRKPEIDRHGSILEAMNASFGVHIERPDFSLPIKPIWKERFESKFLSKWNTGGRPILAYRPIVARREWDCTARNPDPSAYWEIFHAIQERFFVVSVADLLPGHEWIVGQEPFAHIKLHQGELDFGELAALWSAAGLVLSPAGFGPVLAHAVGTPLIVVYGGRESFRTTERASAHLAPTLGIDPDRPCDCHTNGHRCPSKHITIGPAVERVKAFVDEHVFKEPKLPAVLPPITAQVEATPAKVLIFGTSFDDSPERVKLTRTWIDMHRKLNPDCDLMLIDSASPLQDALGELPTYRPGERQALSVFRFADNIGHLSRGGRDGWGRAFCKGLEIADVEGYEYVAHIEGDSLFRIPVRNVVDEMRRERIRVASVPVKGMKYDLQGWIETGLMFFKTDYLRFSKLTIRYNWPGRKVNPTPEVVLRGLVNPHLKMMPWKALRGDKNQITHSTVLDMNLDWVTHCHNDIWVYDRFAEAAVSTSTQPAAAAAPAPVTGLLVPAPSDFKVNLGCGTNKLHGWENHDAEVDITKPLPWSDGTVSHIFIEHCVEHVTWQQAIDFFREARRVLRPGGVLRVVVPSIEQIFNLGTQSYYRFASKWGPSPDKRGAMHAIAYAHGHQMIWSASLLEPALFLAGFDQVGQRQIGESPHAQLRGVEGHGKVIGEEFNRIESIAFEATKGGIAEPTAPSIDGNVAVVVGGSDTVFEEVEAAKALCIEAGKTPTFLAVNDAIRFFPGDCIAVSLHPDKLGGWLAQRRAGGFSTPPQVWAHVRKRGTNIVTDTAKDLGGSSGLFAALSVAVHGLNFSKVVLCGVPMAVEANHFVRHVKWHACHAFRVAWDRHKPEIAKYVRSMSGWTADTFGRPDAEWLKT